jgi:endonuclease/exonuclease/phosphatase family metal-dependent hydrolase
MPRRISLLAAPLLAGAALLMPASAALAAKKTTKVTVMTRNLFLGADLIPLATAPQGSAFEKAAGGLLAEVKAGDPKARMRLVAREIVKAKPDLVGLQEVSIWRTGPKGSSKPARRVLVDYLKVIRRELKHRHAHYRVATKRLGFNVEGPTDRGVDVRLTLGDAVLVRKGVKVRHARSGVFAHQLLIPTQQLGDVNTHRSWNSLDATVRGAHFRFVNAHLEAYSTDFRLQQAKELVAGPLDRRGTTVLAGDLNSGPTLQNPADRPPYEAIAAAGLKPERTKRNSCCFDDVKGAGKWDHNVDWIMARGKVRLVRSYVTGREHTRRGIFPSDHGGVVSVLALPRVSGPRLTG